MCAMDESLTRRTKTAKIKKANYLGAH